jgi:hypothetical protein
MPELAPVIKTLFKIWKMGLAPREALRVAPELIPILTIPPMQECPVQHSRYCASRVKACQALRSQSCLNVAANFGCSCDPGCAGY